jgi:hypothetical protein
MQWMEPLPPALPLTFPLERLSAEDVACLLEASRRACRDARQIQLIASEMRCRAAQQRQLAAAQRRRSTSYSGQIRSDQPVPTLTFPGRSVRSDASSPSSSSLRDVM